MFPDANLNHIFMLCTAAFTPEDLPQNRRLRMDLIHLDTEIGAST